MWNNFLVPNSPKVFLKGIWWTHVFDSWMRSNGSRFTLGVWVLRVCSLEVAQPSATVRNRPREGSTVPMLSSARRVTFGGFTCGSASFRVARVALCDIQMSLATCRRSFCVAHAILLGRFCKMGCSFCGTRSTLDVSIVIYAWQAQHFRRSCCVFFANRIVWAASSAVPTRCKFRGRRGILWDVVKIDGTLARNIDFGVANFQAKENS